MLVERMGANPVRLRNELERLALWAGEGGEVTAADLEEMIADTSEAAVWSLSDALIEGDAAAALRIGERLIGQGENVTGLIYGLASRLRGACAAAAQLEEGIPPKQVESSLKMHPYAAKQLVARLRRHRPRRPAGGDRDPRRPRALVPRRRRLRRRAGADARAAGGAAGRRRLRLLGGAGGDAGGFRPSCGRRCSCAGRPSARPCRSSRPGRAARLAIASASPPSTALSRRRKWVFTVLVSSRFSVRSRSLRSIRFFCEAMLAMSSARAGACRLRAAADYSD